MLNKMKSRLFSGKKISYILAVILLSTLIIPQLCPAQSITFGSEYVFNSYDTWSTSVIALDENNVLIAYQNRGNFYYGTAVIATISGQTISFGPEYVFTNGRAFEFSPAALDANNVLIAYRDDNDLHHGTAIIATISGQTISFGPQYVFNSALTSNLTATTIDENNVLIAYYNDLEPQGSAKIATISGDTISFGEEYVFNINDEYIAKWLSATTINENNVLIAYQEFHWPTFTYNGSAIIATISGDSISFGNKYGFNSGAKTGQSSATTLDEHHVLIAYRDGGNYWYGTAIIARISGQLISFGPEYIFNNADINYPSATALDATHALIAYRDEGNYQYGTAIIATTSGQYGEIITFGTEYVFNGNTKELSAAIFDANNALIAYQDTENLSYGKAIVAEISNVSVTPGDENEYRFSENKLINYPNPFTSSTTIEYGIKSKLKTEPIEIRVYNVMGRLVKTIIATNGFAQLNLSNLPTGIYLYKFGTEKYNEVKKMVLMRYGVNVKIR